MILWHFIFFCFHCSHFVLFDLAKSRFFPISELNFVICSFHFISIYLFVLGTIEIFLSFHEVICNMCVCVCEFISCSECNCMRTQTKTMKVIICTFVAKPNIQLWNSVQAYDKFIRQRQMISTSHFNWTGNNFPANWFKRTFLLAQKLRILKNS